MVLFGLVVFSLYALKNDERVRTSVLSIRALMLTLSGTGLLLSIIGICVLSATMSGAAILDVDRETLATVIFETDVGTAWLLRMAALSAAFVGASIFRTRPVTMLSLACLASGVALASLVWTGHAGATEGLIGALHRIGDIVHMLAAAIWIGGIIAFAILLSNANNLSLTQRALEQFSRVGTVAVILIFVTGLINSQILIGIEHIQKLTTTSYGQLLTIKLALFAVLLGLAAINRWRLTPSLAYHALSSDPTLALRKLRYSTGLEALTMAGILVLVAWLGTLQPPEVF